MCLFRKGGLRIDDVLLKVMSNTFDGHVPNPIDTENNLRNRNMRGWPLRLS